MDKVKYFERELEDLLNYGDGKPAIAVAGSESPSRDAALQAAANFDLPIFELPQNLALHEYKRILNECHCVCLLYSPEYDELAYRIENDGVTFVQTFIPLEPEEA